MTGGLIVTIIYLFHFHLGFADKHGNMCKFRSIFNANFTLKLIIKFKVYLWLHLVDF